MLSVMCFVWIYFATLYDIVGRMKINHVKLQKKNQRKLPLFFSGGQMFLFESVIYKVCVAFSESLQFCSSLGRRIPNKWCACGFNIDEFLVNVLFLHKQSFLLKKCLICANWNQKKCSGTLFISKIGNLGDWRCT